MNNNVNVSYTKLENKPASSQKKEKTNFTKYAFLKQIVKSWKLRHLVSSCLKVCQLAPVFFKHLILVNIKLLNGKKYKRVVSKPGQSNITEVSTL